MMRNGRHRTIRASRMSTSASRPSPLTMPSFAWKLSDREIADVTTYIRTSWGNEAPAVAASAQVGPDVERATAPDSAAAPESQARPAMADFAAAAEVLAQRQHEISPAEPDYSVRPDADLA